MPTRLSRGLLVGLMVFGFTAGCREQPPPRALNWEAVPSTLTASFQGAPPEVRVRAMAVVTSLQGNDVATASLQLQALCGLPELTEPQRDTATRCWLAVKDRLEAAAAAGDAGAGQAVQLQRGVK